MYFILELVFWAIRSFPRSESLPRWTHKVPEQQSRLRANEGHGIASTTPPSIRTAAPLVADARGLHR